jgi:hypothetical protein
MIKGEEMVEGGRHGSGVDIVREWMVIEFIKGGFL